MAYNAANVNQALMRQLASALHHEGVLIPEKEEERFRLALDLIGGDAATMPRPLPEAMKAANECLTQTLEFFRPRDATRPRQSFSITAPKVIPASAFEVIYPPIAIAARKEGTVRVEFTVLEDGGVTGLRLIDPPLGSQLEASAAGLASLRLYVPARSGNCGFPAILTFSVHYRLE